MADYPVAVPFAGAPVLVVDQDRLLTGSLLGREILAQNATEAEALREEGRQLDRQFEDEERALTEQRPTLSPEEFRTLADAFDEKVVRTRAEQQEKSNELAQRVENRRIDFFQQVAPILEAILAETGAAAVIDERATLVANQDLNITGEVIKRLDEVHLARQSGGRDTEGQDE